MTVLDSRSLALIGGMAIAAAAGIYVIWGPSERRTQKRNRRVICPGLVNLGNTCFMNAVLQALAPCLSVGQWLSNLSWTSHNSTHHLATTLHNVIKVLNNDSVEFTEEYSLTDVIRSLMSHGWVISREEQDAHELFHVLTETLNEETSQCSSITSLFDVTRLQSDMSVMSSNEARNRFDTDLPHLERGDAADNPFRGLLASQLQCKTCGHGNSIKYDHFDSLSLSIPTQNIGSLTLDGLLMRYVMPETVDGVVCERCEARGKVGKKDDALPNGSASAAGDQCQPISMFIKQLTIGKLPHCLCIHIQRTSWLSGSVPTKRFDRVSFPEVLSMAPYIYHKKETPSPRLKTLDFDVGAGVRLVGGRRQPSGLKESNLPSSTTSRAQPSSATSPSPTMSVPYSSSVNMLKALNYHTRLAQSGLYALSNQARTGINNDDASQVRRLANAYSTEALAGVGVFPTGSSSQAYKLTAVIVHLGDASSGHFVTYRRAPSQDGQRFPAQWLYTSDTIVTATTLATVLAADAYMLFYEKI